MGANFFHVAALAGAGTGKTYSLVENYLYAILGLDDSGVKKRPQEILALTFTEKAASEMRLRITKRLQELMAAPDADCEITKAAERRHVMLPPKDELRRVMRALPTAHIATFHSFCSQLLRKEATACGVDDGFVILSPREEQNLARNILRPIIIAEIERHNRIIKRLVARMGLAANLSSLGLLDGLLDVYFTLFEKNICPEQLTMMAQLSPVTPAHVADGLARIEQALTTFFNSRQSDKTRARLDHVATALADFKTALAHNHEATTSRAFKKLRSASGGNFGDLLHRTTLVDAIADIGNRLVDHAMQEDVHAIATLLEQFHRAFSTYKTEAMVMTYSDLLEKTKHALTNDLSLRRRVKQRFKHLLIDEYQDTSPIQQDIIAILAEDRDNERRIPRYEPAIEAMDFRNGPSLFVVGDKKQSIYGFRGANVTLFDRMVDKMATTHQETEHFSKRLLVTNRRSDHAVIGLTNLVARHTLHLQGYDEDQALKALPDVRAGRAGLFVSADDQTLGKTAANLRTAAWGIGQLLRERDDLKAQDIVVLVRRIKSASIIVQMLASLGIAARVVGGDGFFQQQEIADLLSALKLINDPGDHLACGVVLRSPLVLLTDQEIMQGALLEKGLTLSAVSSWAAQGLLSDESRERFVTFQRALQEATEALIRDGGAYALDILIDRCDLAYAYGLHESGAQKWANVEKLRTMLAMRAGNPFTIIDDLYQELFNQSREPQAASQTDSNAVTIMTIHQSKGLEFNVVVLADGESSPITNFGDFLVGDELGLVMRPRGRAIVACASSDREDVMATRYERVRREQKAKEDAEVARLLYVALTRARQEIYVSCSAASFAAKLPQQTMVGSFLRARRDAPDEFASLCDVIMVAKPAAHETIAASLPVMSTFATIEKPASAARWFASSFSLDHDEGIASLVVRPQPSSFRKVNGDRAHHLLASVCPLIWHSDDKSLWWHLLDATARAAGKSCDDDDTIAAVRKTMEALVATLHSPSRAISEMPLFSMPTADIVIEGFADLVVESSDFVDVIEFKSSLTRTLDINTYAQVLSYAHALTEKFDKKIRYGVMLVGSSTLVFNEYDDRVREIFLHAVLAQQTKGI